MTILNIYQNWYCQQISKFKPFRTFHERLLFIFAVQSWEQLNSSWMSLAVALILTLLKDEKYQLSRNRSTFTSLLHLYEANKLLKEKSKDDRVKDEPVGTPAFGKYYSATSSLTDEYTVTNMVDSIIEICFSRPEVARRTWQCIFPVVWKMVPSKHHLSVGKYLRQFALASHPTIHNPDVAAFIESLVNLTPPIELKPHHWRYLAATYALQPLAISQLEDAAYRETQMSKRDVVRVSNKASFFF